MIDSILKPRLIASSSDDDASVSTECTAKTMDMNYSSHSSCSSGLDLDVDVSSPSSPKSKSRQKPIQFCEQVAYHLIPNLDELTDDEYYSSFYMEKDFQKMRKENFDFAQKVDKHPYFLSSSEDQDANSLRGIEHYRSRATFEARKNYKRQHCKCVLTTQLQLQISSNQFNDTEIMMDTLSAASSMHSVQSAALAVMQAAADAKEVYGEVCSKHMCESTTKRTRARASRKGLIATHPPTLPSLSTRMPRRNSLTSMMA